MAQEEPRKTRLEELKDARGDHFIRITAHNGKIMFSSHEGYRNKSDMIDSTVKAAVRVLQEYAPEKLSPDAS